ncbi:hypothetical protein DH2020_012447 [Rehmannia glutinosa]|uniref:Uncharacterized protein n=1 Tax=Rehmannia glutinosa TaxID=99300 RepID=A0ABR0X0Q0_REHGL
MDDKIAEIVRSFRTLEFHNLGRVSVQPVFSKVESNSEVDVRTIDLKNSDSLASTFEDIIFSLPRAASFVAKTSRKDKNPIRLSSNAAQSNIPDDILPVIKYPLGTECAIKAMLECNTLVFVVDKCADKKNIKDSVEKMFKIRAKKVNTVITPDGTKKAYVMLASDCNALDVDIICFNIE